MAAGGEKIDIDRDVLQNKPLMARLAAGDVGAADSVLRLTGEEPLWWKRVAVKRIARTQTVSEEEKTHTFVRQLSIGMFVLMPLFALLLKLFYRRQRPLYLQHLIFSVHLHCFFFLLISAALLVRYALPTLNPSPVLTLVAWWYWVVALRRFSGQGWGRTLWKSALLFGGYLLLLTLFMFGQALALLLLV